MALPSLAWAGNPSLDQYVESVPTGHGNGPAHGGPGGGGSGGSALPQDTRRQIERQGGSDAGALEAVAGDPALGAPEASAKARRGAGTDKPGARNAKPGGSAPTAAGTASPSTVDAVTSAATGGDGSAAPWLLLGLALLTAFAAAAALVRRRSLT